MKQKDIYLADLSPIKGQEQEGVRPVVIISGPSMNNYFNLVTVCPLSSKIKNYPVCAVIRKNARNGLNQDSEILTFHIRTISKDRLIKKLGEISGDQLEKIFQGLFDILRF
ncbi:MAG: type II toxin-antitoxin system PemK/MazF family toxin [Candidatus Gracilibacteria bacterium]